MYTINATNSAPGHASQAKESNADLQSETAFLYTSMSIKGTVKDAEVTQWEVEPVAEEITLKRVYPFSQLLRPY